MKAYEITLSDQTHQPRVIKFKFSGYADETALVTINTLYVDMASITLHESQLRYLRDTLNDVLDNK